MKRQKKEEKIKNLVECVISINDKMLINVLLYVVIHDSWKLYALFNRNVENYLFIWPCFGDSLLHVFPYQVAYGFLTPECSQDNNKREFRNICNFASPSGELGI